MPGIGILTGHGPDPVPVSWEVAEDAGFRTVVAKGTETAWPELAHSVHAEVTGLRPPGGQPPHLELLCYRQPRSLPAMLDDDAVLASRTVMTDASWNGFGERHDPDGHWLSPE